MPAVIRCGLGDATFVILLNQRCDSGDYRVARACTMQCPPCFRNAGAGFSLTLDKLEEILDGVCQN